MVSELYSEKSSVMGLWGYESPNPLGLQLPNLDKQTHPSIWYFTPVSSPLQTPPPSIQKVVFGNAAEMCNFLKSPFLLEFKKSKALQIGIPVLRVSLTGHTDLAAC